jgi:hypothetical protein
MLGFPLQMPAYNVSSVPVLIIWIMWFVMPWVYLRPVSVRAYLRSCAKAGWLFVLAALACDVCAINAVYSKLQGEMIRARR